MVLIGALPVLWRTHSRLKWHGLSCLVAVLVLLPWIQFSLGLIPFAGQAWISSCYLMGFLLALLVGARWQMGSPDQLVIGLFSAVGLAAIVSVGLQLYTWLNLSEGGALGLWALGDVGNRPSANLGQPNQLATLLIWGLLACFWAYSHRVLSAASAIFTASFLLLGLALTQSRTGLLAASAVLLAVWVWRSLWPSRVLPLVASSLFLYLLICPTLLRWLKGALLLGQDEVYVMNQQSVVQRLSAWRLFAQAILERPMFGYGWSETTSAQMAVADQFPSLGGVFSHSHNLFLDLALWTGIPIGALIGVVLIRWFWLRFRALRQGDDAILLLVVGVVGIHALLEFPLQYAYFLIPAGLIMGILNVRTGARVLWTSTRWVLGAVWLAAAIGLGVTIRDYARVDASYIKLRLEQGLLGQGRPPLGGPPDVWVLTQMREWIRMQRYKVHPKMSQQELDEMVVMTTWYPSLSSAYRLATALALNARPDEARAWLGKICQFTDDRECSLAQRTWEVESQNSPSMGAIAWPR